MIKSLQYFHKDKTTSDNHTARCIKCTKLYYKRYYQKIEDKKSHFVYKSLKDPNYLKDKRDLFNSNGNGWWWIDRSRSQGRKKIKRKE